MTPIGRIILNVYSIGAVMIAIGISFYRVCKSKDRGIELAALLPVLIFLINVL